MSNVYILESQNILLIYCHKMTWGWSIRNEPLATGGAVGTPAEARVPEAWPDYEAEYLKHRLNTKQGRFRTNDLDGSPETSVYLDAVSKNYKEEAEACLKAEFLDWLQGKHADNSNIAYYKNEGTKPKRRNVYSGVIGEEKKDFVATPWGKEQLTYLPGVRDYLRKQLQHKDSAELQMNLLAEHGPQNLEEAWMYFKHWVKGRPVGIDTCPMDTPEDAMSTFDRSLGARSDFHYQPPNGGRNYKLPEVKPDDAGFELPPEKHAEDYVRAKLEAEQNYDELIGQFINDSIKFNQELDKSRAVNKKAEEVIREHERTIREQEETINNIWEWQDGAIRDIINEEVLEPPMQNTMEEHEVQTDEMRIAREDLVSSIQTQTPDPRMGPIGRNLRRYQGFESAYDPSNPPVRGDPTGYSIVLPAETRPLRDVIGADEITYAMNEVAFNFEQAQRQRRVADADTARERSRSPRGDFRPLPGYDDEGEPIETSSRPNRARPAYPRTDLEGPMDDSDQPTATFGGDPGPSYVPFDPGEAGPPVQTPRRRRRDRGQLR